MNAVIDRILKKRWNDTDLYRYIGTYQRAYLSHARMEETRSKSASGGTISAILIDGLVNRQFEGAVVCNSSIEDGKLRAHFKVATTACEILAARGSKYVETRFMREVIPLIRKFEGRIAVVGLPCDISALKRRFKKDPELYKKVVLTCGLVCGHNSRTELIDEIIVRLERETGKRLTNFCFRVGHWRGRMEAEFEGGEILSKPTKHFNDYHNLFFFCERKCMVCHDHFAYDADISVGDVWLFRLKKDPIKHNGVITRTERGQDIFNRAITSGSLEAAEISIYEIMDGQARIGPSHYNVSARHKAGKSFGLYIKDKVQQQVSWHAYLNALITVANMRLSETEWGRTFIFSVPRPVLKMYLYAKKALESLK